MDATSTPTRAVGKLESLPKEELLKFIKKQAISSKELKKKIEDLNTQLKGEHDEIKRLEKEKKDWISRGVTAEFEKKDKLVKKNKELELAAQLGKEMLEENDDLQVEIEEMKREHDDTIQSIEDELESALREKEILEGTLDEIRDEYKSAKVEAEECRIALTAATDIHDKDVNALTLENKEFREKVQDLEHQLNTSTVNLKLHKLKEKYEEVIKENKAYKEAKLLSDEDSSIKSEQLVAIDKDMKILRKEFADHQKQRKADILEMDSMRTYNNELAQSLQDSEDKVRELDEEVQKVKAEKEKHAKTLRNMKTKLERATQMEEELKKQLNIIVCERDDLTKKLQKKNQQKTKGKAKSPREDDLAKVVADKSTLLKELENHISVLEAENSELQESAENFSQSSNEMHERYQNLQKDFDSLSFEIDESTAAVNTLSEEKGTILQQNNELIEKIKNLEETLESLHIEKESMVVQQSLLQANMKTFKENDKKSTQEKESMLSKIKHLEDEKKKTTKTTKGKRSKPAAKTVQKVTVDQSVQCDDHDDEETKLTILKYEARVNELLNQLQRINEEKHNQENELEELFNSHDDLQNKYDFECQERQKKENELHSLEERMVKLESEKKDGKDVVAVDLEQQISYLEEQVRELTKEGKHYQNEVTVKEEHIIQLRSEIQDLQQKQTLTNTANNKEVDNIVQEFEHMDKEFNATKIGLENSIHEKESMMKKINDLENEKTRVVQTLSVTAQKLLEMKKNLDAKLDEVNVLKEQIEELNSKTVETATSKETNNIIIELNEKITELKEKIPLGDDLINQNKLLHEEIRSLQNDLESFDMEYKRVLTDNVHLKQSFERMIVLKTELQTKLEELHVKFSHGEKEIATMKESVHCFNNIKLKIDCENNDNVEKYLDSILSTNQNLTLQQTNYESLTDEFQLLKSDNKDLSAKLIDMQQELTMQHTATKEKDTMFQQTQLELASLEKESEVLNKQKVDLELNLSTTQELLNEKNIEINNLVNNTKELENKTEASLLISNVLADLKEDVKAKDILINDLSNTVQQMKLNIANVETSIVQANENADEQEHTLKEELLQKEADIAHLQSEVKQLINETMNLKTTEENYLNELHEKQSLVNQLTEDVDKNKSVNENLSEQQCKQELIWVEELNEINIKLGEYKELNKKLEHVVTELTDYSSLMENENKSLTDELNLKESQCENLKILFEEKAQLLLSLKESMNEQSDKLQIVEEFEQYKIDYQKIEEELQSALNKVDELETELKGYQETSIDLQQRVKEKEEKALKFRSVAIKTKKELESLRTRSQAEKEDLAQQSQAYLEEGKRLKADLVRQKTECGKHEEEFEEMQSEIKDLQDNLITEKNTSQKLKDGNAELLVKIEQMTLNISITENKLADLSAKIDQHVKENESLKESLQKEQDNLLTTEANLTTKTQELEKLKNDSESMQQTLSNAHKETQQVNMMNLEIDDYHRTIENLQTKSNAFEKQSNDSRVVVEKLTTTQKSLDDQISLLRKERTELEERGRKLKVLIVKLKKEVADGKKTGEEDRKTIEELKQTNDQMKIELSELISNKSNLTQQIKSSVETNQKSYQALEVKYARVNSDLTALQRTYKDLEEEYKNYKVRAQNVLKKQKAMKIDSEKEIENIERKRLEEMTEQLKLKLQEISQKLNLLQLDNGELELEHERLQTRHNQFVQEITEKETGWKQRFEQMKKEKTTKVLEYEDKVKILTKENKSLLKSAKEHSELAKADEEEYMRELSSLKDEMQKLQLQQQQQQQQLLSPPPLSLELHKQESNESLKNDSLTGFHKSVFERQEGEGMDSKELELIDTLSQRSSSTPQTPISPTAASVLEKLLSPIESQYLMSPQTPGSMREELFTIRTALSTSLKKVEHITALLRESEANACRLDDQAKVLKEEIRRLERNEQREQALSNLEYLKNVIIKFLKVSAVEREQLIPVLCSMLKLSNDEKQFIAEYAKGGSIDSDDPQQTWSSYVYRWTSLS